MKNLREVLLAGGSLVLLLSLMSGLFISPSYRHTHRHGDHSHIHGSDNQKNSPSSATDSALHEATSHYHVVIFGWTFTLMTGEHNSQFAKDAASADPEQFTITESRNIRPLQNLNAKQVEVKGPAFYQWNCIDNSWLASLMKWQLYYECHRPLSPAWIANRIHPGRPWMTGIGRAAPPLPPPETCLI